MRKIVAILGTLLILWCLMSVYLVPSGIQYVMDAGEELPDIREETCAVHAIVPETNFSYDNKLQVSGELYAINQRYTEFYPLYLTDGRLFYQEEALKGGDQCLIEERVAFKLFKNEEPLGKTLTIEGQDYRIVGVVKNAADVGTKKDSRVYVPFRGAKGSFKTLVRTDTYFEEEPSGTKISLQKEKMRATLLARLLAVYLGASVLCVFVRWLKRYGQANMNHYHVALQDKYPRQLFFRFLPPTFFTIFLWALCAAAGVGLLSVLLEPAFTFVEWVPDVLVEWSSIQEMFWKNMRAQSAAVQYQTQELIRLNHWGYVTNIGCVMVLLAIGRIKGICRQKKDI